MQGIITERDDNVQRSAGVFNGIADQLGDDELGVLAD